jgi:general secretion pathway protein G
MSSDRHNRRRRRYGFSLVEIMVVVVIIGLLAGLVTVGVQTYMSKARQNAARSDISRIKDAMGTFYTEYARYPTNEEGLEILTRPNEKFPHPLLERTGAMEDPWGNTYVYLNPGRDGKPEVISYGADGSPGGEGENADISSQDL